MIWNRRVRGLRTAEEAEATLEQLATSRLDRDVHFSSYRGLEEVGGTPFDWLDIDIQLQTLRQSLPQDVDSQTDEQDAPFHATARTDWSGGGKEAA